MQSAANLASITTACGHYLLPMRQSEIPAAPSSSQSDRCASDAGSATIMHPSLTGDPLPRLATGIRSLTMCAQAIGPPWWVKSYSCWGRLSADASKFGAQAAAGLANSKPPPDQCFVSFSAGQSLRLLFTNGDLAENLFLKVLLRQQKDLPVVLPELNLSSSNRIKGVLAPRGCTLRYSAQVLQRFLQVVCAGMDTQAGYSGYQVALWREIAADLGWADSDWFFSCVDWTEMINDLVDPAGNCTFAAAGNAWCRCMQDGQHTTLLARLMCTFQIRLQQLAQHMLRQQQLMQLCERWKAHQRWQLATDMMRQQPET